MIICAPMDTNSKTRPNKLALIIVGALIVMGALVAVGFAIPANTSNGLENYDGVKLEAARNVLNFADRSNTGWPEFLIASRLRVESQPNDKCGDSRDSDNTNDIHHYSVTIAAVWLFRMKHTMDYPVCRTAG
jgi:hypothetical protein